MSTERDLDVILGSWLDRSAAELPSPKSIAAQVLAQVPSTPQQHRWLPSIDTWSPRTTVNPTRFVLAGVSVLLLGGVLLATLASRGPEGAAPLAGAPDPASPAIHWQSGVVDLRADSMTLRVGDDVFTTEGVEVVVDGYDGDMGQWALYPRWIEDGQNHWLYLEFSSDGRTWRLNPWLWRDGLDRSHSSAGDPLGAYIELGRGSIRMPLGEPYVGDWRLEDRIEVPRCGAPNDTVDVSLTFENLRLSVSPRNPSVIDGFMYDMFHRGSFLGELFNGALEPPEPRVLDCPA